MAVVPSSALAETRIGILLWNSQPRYEQCKEGGLEVLRREGFKEGEATVVVEQAYGNHNTAAQLARKFAESHLAIVVPIGTSAALAAAEAMKDTPVVFAMVFDPVAVKIAQDWKTSGNNTTGSSSKAPASALLGALRRLTAVKKLAVLYTPGEANSEAQLTDFEDLQKEYAITTIAVPLRSRVEVEAALNKVAAAPAEAVVLTGSSVIGDTVAQIVLLASRVHIVTATQSEDHVDKGVLLGVTVDPRAVGRLAGEKAVRVLRGATPASIPIEALKTSQVMVNLKTAKASGIDVPADVRKMATRLVE